jgi:murein DD-endopeptidase MepM/ murein hydrolase activator NlpD
MPPIFSRLQKQTCNPQSPMSIMTLQLKSISRTILLAIATVALATSADAQTKYRLPKEHTAQQNDLIAGQINTSKQIKASGLDNIFEQEEDEPELDIYTEGWNSKLVNAYNGASVPYSQKIDVSDYCMPCPGYMTSPYGYRKRFKRMHKGVDLKIYIGDTIRAAFDGKVRLTNYEGGGYGNYVIIRHTNGLETVYGHLSRALVKADQYVHAGDPIALGGNTGRSTGPHLHFETRFMGYAINPAAIFDFANQTVHTDEFTFCKDTYQNARNFDPNANTEYAREFNERHSHQANNSSSASKATRQSKTYKVKKGDTLAKIASRNGVTVRQLCRINGLKSSSKIRPGQSIKIR